MDSLTDYVLVSRLQFGLTTLFHMLWPILTIGLSLFLLLLEAFWLRTGKDEYFRLARFWSKVFLLNFALGVVTGVPLQFQFGTNWAPFAAATGDFLGNILGFEASMAFMLEAGFLGIMLFGWRRVAPGMHLFATAMVAFGASLSAFWIMSASSWMNTPAGVHFTNGKVVVDSYYAAIFNPGALTSMAHMWLACIETTAFLVGSISAWYILKNRHKRLFLISFTLAIYVAAVVTPLQIVVGDLAGTVVARYQPAKLAAMEAHWETNGRGEGAAWVLLAWPDEPGERNDWSVEVPGLLSLLVTHSLTGEVKGMRSIPSADRPPMILPFVAFRVMLCIGLALLVLSLWTLWQARRGQLREQSISAHPWLLRSWILAAPLGYVAVEMGWLTREVGRQPWLVHGFLRTHAGATVLPVEAVEWSLAIYVAIYTLLLSGFLYFGRVILLRGPDLDESTAVGISERDETLDQ
jgi:cytochrome bd ubiquinol oxidase subunit I